MTKKLRRAMAAELSEICDIKKKLFLYHFPSCFSIICYLFRLISGSNEIGMFAIGIIIGSFSPHTKALNAPNRRVFCSYNEIIMRFEVEDKRAYSLIYIMSAFGCLYVHDDTRICTKNQGEIECLLRLPGQMCLLR